jgi:hypothetical protein
LTEIRDAAEPDLRNVAFVFTCDPCAAEFFPQAQLPRVAGVLGPGDWDGEMRSAVVHAACAAYFVANGFEIVGADPDDPEDSAGPDLFCPHYKWDEAAEEWKAKAQ